MMASVTSLVLNIAVLCVIIASLPLLTCSAVKFYRHKSHQIMSYRDPYYVMAVVLIVVIGLVIECIPRCLHNMNVKMYSLDAMLLIETMITYGVLFLFCLKSYLLFFQQRYHSSIQNVSWKKEIDAQHEQNNFYIVNRNKWGSFSYVLRWISIPYLWLFVFDLLAMLDIAGLTLFCVVHTPCFCLGLFSLAPHQCAFCKHYTHSEWLEVVSICNKVLFAVLPVIIFIILTYQLGEFYDVYGIKREIFGQFVCSVLLFVSYGLIAAATANSANLDLRDTLQVAIFVLLYCFFAVSTVCHPLYLLKEQQKQSMDENSFKAGLSMSSSVNNIEGILASLRDERVFSLFMQHLVSEFATENLLFIVELCQIKHHYLKAQHWVLKISKNGGGFRGHDDVDVASLANNKNSLSVGGGSSHNMDNQISSKPSDDDKYLVMDFNACRRRYNEPLSTASPTSADSQPMLKLNNLSVKNDREDSKEPELDTKSPSIPIPTRHPSFKQNVSRSISVLLSIDAFVIGYVLSDTNTYDMLQIEIPKTMPTSTIITGEAADMYALIHALYKKYVAAGSDFEINIPFTMRENIGIALQHYQDCQQDGKTHPNLQMVEGDLFWIMDAACLELFRLLLGPFRRFQLSEKYQQYVNSMEHQARHANVELDQIVQDRVRSQKPVLHSASSYDRVKTHYHQKP